MKVSDLISLLQSMPQYADVLIDEGAEYHDFTVDVGDDYPETGAALVILKL